jgi:Ca2+-binding EF-hand superfamily protein
LRRSAHPPPCVASFGAGLFVACSGCTTLGDQDLKKAKKLMRDARLFRNLEIDEGPEALPVAEQLAHALRKHAGKILDLFRTWDADGDGGVTLAEFIKAMHSLGLERKLAKSLFRDWDKTSDGALSFRELQRILTTQAGGEHDHPYALGENSPRRMVSFRERRKLQLGTNLDLRKAAAGFADHDADGNAKLDYEEFLAMQPREIRETHSDAIIRGWFEAADLDRDGNLSVDEWYRYSLSNVRACATPRTKVEDSEAFTLTSLLPFASARPLAPHARRRQGGWGLDRSRPCLRATTAI